MSNDKDLLVRELRRRSAGMTDTTIGLDSVKARARGIRRRRRALTGVAAAVVLAVGIPVGVNVGGSLRTDAPLPPTNQTPSVVPTPTDRDFPEGPVRLTTKGLPTGQDPRVPYVVYGENVLVTPDADIEVPHDIATMARFRDGWIAHVVPDGGGLDVAWLDADLSVVRSRPSLSSTLVTSADGSQVGWTENRPGTRKQTLYAASAAGGTPRSWPVESQGEVVEPVGFLGPDRLVFTEPVNYGHGITEADGSVTELPGFQVVRAASEASGLVAGQTDYGKGRSCSAVVEPDVSTTRVLWSTCDYQLETFSPNGAYVIGTPSDADALGAPSVAVLDAHTGDVLVRFEPDPDDQLSMYDLAWEDDDAILAMTQHGVDVSILRLNLSGKVEQVGRAGTAKNMGVPFRFATGPGY